MKMLNLHYLKMNAVREKGRMLKRAMALLCAFALVLSAVLFFHAMNGRGLIGCAPGTGCDQVLGSRWSFIFGFIPLGAPGFCCYAVLLAIILLADSLDDRQFSLLMWRLSVIAAGAVLGSAGWFIYVQRHFIGAFCPYCMSTHCAGIVLSLLLPVYVRVRDIVPRFLHRALLFAAGLCLASAFAVAHLLTTPDSAYDKGYVQEELPDVGSLGLPELGGAGAEYRIVLMYDYRCSHCRKLHAMLPEVLDLLDGRFGFVLCPTPISRECNPYVDTDTDLFAGSCTSDKCAMAVWRRNPEAFPEMDDFLFGAGRDGEWCPRNPEEARAKAVELIGEQVLEEELHSEWMRTYLALVSELFGRTSAPGKGAVPRFIYGGHYLVPDADNANALAALVRGLVE